MDPGESKEPSGPVRKASSRRSTKADFDLDAAYRSLQFQSRELPEEVEARLLEKQKAEDHARWKEKVILIATLFGLSAIGGPCLVVALRPGASEDKKWAMAVLASIVSVGVGYLGGKASKPD